jgi:hypothetical protein
MSNNVLTPTEMGTAQTMHMGKYFHEQRFEKENKLLRVSWHFKNKKDHSASSSQ